MQKVIKINEELSDKIQAVQYEVKSRQDLLAYMVSSGISPSNDAYRAYHKEYQEFYVQYEAAKEELEKAVKPQIPGRMTEWNLTFDTNEVTCTYEAN